MEGLCQKASERFVEQVSQGDRALPGHVLGPLEEPVVDVHRGTHGDDASITVVHHAHHPGQDFLGAFFSARIRDVPGTSRTRPRPLSTALQGAVVGTSSCEQADAVDEIGRLLREQSGVISRRQVLEHGGTVADIQRALRRREWVRLLPGVFIDHTGEPTWVQRAWAGVLFYHPAALSGMSALRAVAGPGWRRYPDHLPIEIAVDVGRTVQPVDGYRPAVEPGSARACCGTRARPGLRVEEAALDVAARLTVGARHRRAARRRVPVTSDHCDATHRCPRCAGADETARLGGGGASRHRRRNPLGPRARLPHEGRTPPWLPRLVASPLTRWAARATATSSTRRTGRRSSWTACSSTTPPMLATRTWTVTSTQRWEAGHGQARLGTGLRSAAPNGVRIGICCAARLDRTPRPAAGPRAGLGRIRPTGVTTGPRPSPAHRSRRRGRSGCAGGAARCGGSR